MQYVQQFVNLISPFPSYLFTQFTSVYITIGIAVAIYVFFAYCIERIARKVNVSNTWRAYIPYVNDFLLFDIAGISYVWLIVVFLPLVEVLIIYSGGAQILVSISPLLQIISLGILALNVYIWMKISERLGKSMWLGIFGIVPIANLILPIYLAFSDSTMDNATNTTLVSSAVNWQHPELQNGERFLGNYTAEDFNNKLRWQTKRRGQIAYDKYGNKEADQNLHPIFVQESELQKAGWK